MVDRYTERADWTGWADDRRTGRHVTGLGGLSGGFSSTTLAQIRSIVEHHLKPILGDIVVNKLTTIDIYDMYRSLSRCGGRYGRPLAPGTVHRVHVVLYRALTQAVRWEWIWLNPAANAPTLVTPWAAIDFTHSAIGFSRAYVDGPAGPVLRATDGDLCGLPGDAYVAAGVTAVVV
jgi:Phage integrase, N-terminal SAM-like domain